MRPADQEQIIQNGSDLSPEAKSRGFRLMVASSVFAVIGGQVFSGNILMIIAWHLGGRERYVGVLFFLVSTISLWQLFITRMSQRTSKKGLIIFMLVITLFLTSPVLATKWVVENAGLILFGASDFFADWDPHRLGVMLGLGLLAVCVSGRALCLWTYFPSWMGMLREMTPASRRGRLLGQLRTSWQAAMVIVLIATGLYLGSDPDWAKLRIIILLGLLAQLFRLLVIIPVPPVPQRQPARNVSWWEMISTPVRDQAYRPFLLYMLVYGFALGLSERFRIAYLLRLEFGEQWVLISTSLIAIGAVVTLVFWGKVADRFGNRGVFGLTLAGMLGSTVLWLLVGRTTWGLVLAMILLGITGAFNAGHGLVQTRYMFASLRPGLDAAYIAATTSAMQLAVGIGCFVGGYALDLLKRAGLDPASGGFNNYHVIFLASAGMFLISAYFRRNFREPTEPPTRQVLTAITQPLRVIVGPLLFWPRNSANSDENDRSGRSEQ